MSVEKFIVFGRPHFGEEETNEVVDSIKSGWIGTGPKVKLFEERFKEYENSRYAVAVNSCTSALHLSIIVAGIGDQDEVITTSMTFCSTVNAIIHSGATPVIVDCDRETYCIDTAQIEAKITNKTKAIIPVHFAGNACEMDKLMKIARKYNLKVIEDCAHAIETTYSGKHVGTIGDFGCFSFYVTKNLTTGEGGMVLTEDENHANKLKIMALHGLSRDAWHRFSDTGYKHYDVMAAGFKYNMMDIQAAMGLHQLAKIEPSWQRRKEIWDRYQKELRGLPIKLPAEPAKNVKHGYHLFPVLIQDESGITRDGFLNYMQKNNIGVGVHYQAIPSHTFYREKYGWIEEDYPNSKEIGEKTVSIPLSPGLSNGEVDYIINTIKNCF
ncbi:DegT/DnrJ/EryC1/StrS family aminotransferase [bacterium]|nr:DegT/DnrJ/EryC1/StrS family aminotransferase [bacterium]